MADSTHEQNTEVTHQTRFTPDIGLRVSAMLDTRLQGADAIGNAPTGWHFPLIGAETLRGDLRPDGFPGLGLPLLHSSLPRLVAGGRCVAFHRPLPVDAPLVRKSRLASVKHKDTSSGPLSILTITHSIQTDGVTVALEESQTFLLLSSRHVERNEGEAPPDFSPIHSKIVTPDDTLLFQFSALSFNSHKIHLDRDHARNVEGFPDLVVNGGLTTLLMTEMARADLGLNIKAITVTNKRPLYANRAITLSAYPSDSGTRILAIDDQHRVAAEMEIASHEL